MEQHFIFLFRKQERISIQLTFDVLYSECQSNKGKEQTMYIIQNALKATPHNDRLTALRAACLHIFRQLAQILLEILQYSRVGFIQADEKSGDAIHTQSLCGVALKI